MIRNLIQLNFKGFGTVSPERPTADTDISPKCQLSATQKSAPVYRTTCSTWLYCGGVSTVLSVSLDGNSFQHYYLDKTLCLNEGIYFSISPFLVEQVTAGYIAQQAPELVSPGPVALDLNASHRLRVTDLYTFFYHEKEQGFFFSGEAHPMLELTYVDQGTMHSVADGQDLLLSQGDMVLYGPNQWHMQYSDIGVAPRYVTLSFDVEGGDLSSLLSKKITPPQNVTLLLQQMLREQERMDLHSTDVILSQLTLLLLELLRQHTGPAQKLRTSNALHSENEIIRRAQQYISAHIREKLSVPIVARMVDVSPSYLTALFHKNLQISPGEYIRRIKLQESKQMIRENSMNFTEIAAALQYSTVHHFSRQFKEKFGITPTEYAKSVR